MSFNIYQCLTCKRRLIAEEAPTHECKSVEKYQIKEQTLWVFDGKVWYPLKLRPTENQQPKKTTDEKTKPL